VQETTIRALHLLAHSAVLRKESQLLTIDSKALLNDGHILRQQMADIKHELNAYLAKAKKKGSPDSMNLRYLSPVEAT
jgi:hypothetical protein